LGKIILIRGLPGSGKTTAAKEFDCFHLEADMFFVRDNIYSFNKEHIKEAHEFCQKMAETIMETGADLVVSNTFTTKKELDPYLTLAKKYNYDISVFTVVGNFKNKHNVPEEVIKKMKNRFEKIEEEQWQKEKI